VTRWALELDGVGYHYNVCQDDPELRSHTEDWVRRITPAAVEAGGIVFRCRLDYEYAVVPTIRWVGEQIQVELRSGPFAANAIWWTPPEPPPAGLMRYATRVSR
jgi:hypothetical protein